MEIANNAETYTCEPRGNIKIPYNYPSYECDLIVYHQVHQYIIALSYTYPAMFEQNMFDLKATKFFLYRIGFLYLNLASFTQEALEEALFLAWRKELAHVDESLFVIIADMSLFDFIAVLDCMASRSMTFQQAYKRIQDYRS